MPIRRAISFLIVTVLALVVAPYAQATWKHNTQALTENAKVTFSGNMLFTSAIGGVSCSKAQMSATLTPVWTADFDSTTLSSCIGTGGLGACFVGSITPTYRDHEVLGKVTPLPWSGHTSLGAVTVTGLHLDYTFSGAFCPYHALTIFGDVMLTPNDLVHMSSVTMSNLSGALKAYNGTTGQMVSTITASGTLNVTPAGTYGI